MLNLPIVSKQVILRGNVGCLDAPIAAQLFTFGHRGQGIALKRFVEGRGWSKKIGKNWGRKWYAHSANGDHTDHENGKCGFCGRFQARPSIHFWP